jgi:hypothetical protein
MPVLVCGLPDEDPVALLIASLERAGADYRVIDEERMAEDVALRWQVDDRGVSGHIRIQSEVFAIDEITGIYHRFVDPENLPACCSTAKNLAKSRSVLHSLMDLFDILPARVVNRRRPMMSNNSKPYQALLIKKAGFSIPATLVTGSVDSLAAFAAASGPLIYKSASSVRSVVARLDDRSMEKIPLVPNLPTQFQHKIEGFNLRVHVVGRRLFATRILTPATDYRYAANEGMEAEFRPYEMTEGLRKRCLLLSKICRLPFCGIDLIIGKGRTTCLEVNPSPGYSYYQEKTGQPIADALADYLVRQ